MNRLAPIILLGCLLLTASTWSVKNGKYDVVSGKRMLTGWDSGGGTDTTSAWATCDFWWGSNAASDASIWIAKKGGVDLKQESAVQRPSYSGGVYTFDGSDDTLTNELPLLVTNGYARTFSAWVNDAGGVLSSIVGQGSDGDDSESCIMFSIATLGSSQFGFWGRGCNVWGAYGSASTWYHLVAVYDGTDVIVYLNGVEQGRSPKTLITRGPHAHTLRIGYIDYGAYWSGSLKEVMLWNKALTAGEVTNLYTGGVWHQ